MYELLRPLMRMWFSGKLRAGASSPQPRDAQRASTGEADAESVLLLGNGPCHGWGVLSHQLALTGQLTRAVAETTHRGVNVEYVGNELMNMASSVAWLGSTELKHFDTVMVVIGFNDAARLTAVHDWNLDLTRLIETLLIGLDDHTRIVIASVQRVSSVAAFEGFFGRVADHHARKLNRYTERLIARYDRVDFMRLADPQPELDGRIGSPETYREFAQMLAPVVSRALVTTRSLRRDVGVKSRRRPAARGFEWKGMAPVIELARMGGSQVLQQIGAAARETFDIELAAVSLLDGDRLWYATPIGLPSSVPRQLSFCQHAVDGRAPLIVQDSRTDSRFRDNPLIALAQVHFYAGIPLQSTTGELIGTFCIMGAKPREASSIDLDALRQLAAAAQDELWRFESTMPSQPIYS